MSDFFSVVFNMCCHFCCDESKNIKFKKICIKKKYIHINNAMLRQLVPDKVDLPVHFFSLATCYMMMNLMKDV